MTSPVVFPHLPEIFDPIAWWSTVDGARTAIIDGATDMRYSYRDVHRDADRWHALLVHLGVQQGDRVGILAQNRYEFIPLFFACIRRGAILVPLNWRLTPVELSRVLLHCEPAIVFADNGARTLLAAAMAHTSRSSTSPAALPVHDLDGNVPAIMREIAHLATPASPVRGIDDTTMLLYTSGSTGAPKGVMLPHRQLLWNALATTTAWRLGADDIGTAATPFFHTSGWHVFATTLLSRGGAVVVVGPFEPSQHLDLLDRHGVTVSFGVPTQFAMLRDGAGWGRPLPKLRWFFSGGAPCPQRIKKMVRDAGYNLRDGYGLTECGPNCFATNDDTVSTKDGSTGWPVPFLDMRLRADDGSLAGTDVVGELELRGPQLFSGYFRAPEQTAEVMTDDGWLRTGDLASRDSDGVYRIRGRRREMYISGGENVFPGEVEAALLDCQGVRAATVIGVPDARWGEVGCALVVRQDETLSEAALLAAARTRLAGYKVPKRIVFVQELPRLGSGKIDRQAAASLIAEA